MAKSNKWIQHAIKRGHKGALHRQLGISKFETIPEFYLIEIKHAKIGSYVGNEHKVKVTRLLKKRANLALNLRRMK
jgi:hypothetical protein